MFDKETEARLRAANEELDNQVLEFHRVCDGIERSQADTLAGLSRIRAELEARLAVA